MPSVQFTVAQIQDFILRKGFGMHSITAIVILGLALAISMVVQVIVFLLILRSERKFTKDLLNRLASRSVVEYAQATKILEEHPTKEAQADEEGRPIPIFS